MFDVEKAICEWRGQMAARGINALEILDELENHLRDEIASRINSGCGEENAFHAAVRNIGEGTALQAEFAKVSEADLRSNTFVKRCCRVAAFSMLLINTCTLLEYELSTTQRLFGIIAVTIICFYLAWLPQWLEAFRGYRLSWLASLIKAATILVWLWPVVALLDTHRILRLELGILPATLIWCVYAAVVMTAVAYGLIHGAKRDRGGSPPPRFQPPPIPGPMPLSSPADPSRLLPRSRPVDPIVQQCMESACGEASRLGHCYIGTEHLLLGLLRVAQGSFANVLRKLNVNCEQVRGEIERLVCPVPAAATTPAIPLTPRARKAIRLAAREAKAMNRSLIGAEDLLVGLLREGGGVGAQALRNLGVHIQKARAEILDESRHHPIC
jgi:hypothetical protein